MYHTFTSETQAGYTRFAIAKWRLVHHAPDRGWEQIRKRTPWLTL